MPVNQHPHLSRGARSDQSMGVSETDFSEQLHRSREREHVLLKSMQRDQKAAFWWFVVLLVMLASLAFSEHWTLPALIAGVLLAASAVKDGLCGDGWLSFTYARSLGRTIATGGRLAMTKREDA